MEIGSIIYTMSGKQIGVRNIFPTEVPGALYRIESHERRDYLVYGESMKEIACSDIEIIEEVMPPCHLGY